MAEANGRILGGQRVQRRAPRKVAVVVHDSLLRWVDDLTRIEEREAHAAGQSRDADVMRKCICDELRELLIRATHAEREAA